jgi:hypothetical protein
MHHVETFTIPGFVSAQKPNTINMTTDDNPGAWATSCCIKSMVSLWLILIMTSDSGLRTCHLINDDRENLEGRMDKAEIENRKQKIKARSLVAAVFYQTKLIIKTSFPNPGKVT